MRKKKSINFSTQSEIDIRTCVTYVMQLYQIKLQGLELDFFRAGPRSVKPGGPNQSMGAQTKVWGPEPVYICSRFENFGGPSGPRPQKPRGHLENPEAIGPWAPMSGPP